MSNPNPFSCLVSVRVRAGPAGRVVTAPDTGTMTLVVNTFTDSSIVTAVGQTDPNLTPEQRRLVTASVPDRLRRRPLPGRWDWPGQFHGKDSRAVITCGFCHISNSSSTLSCRNR